MQQRTKPGRREFCISLHSQRDGWTVPSLRTAALETPEVAEGASHVIRKDYP